MLPPESYKAPKIGKNVSKYCQCWHISALCRYIIGTLLAISVHNLVKEVISFNLSHIILKLDKNCL